MPRPLLSVCFPCHPHSSWVSCVALTALGVQVLNCSLCRLAYFLFFFRYLSFVGNPLFLYPWLVELKSAIFLMSFLGKNDFLKKKIALRFGFWPWLQCDNAPVTFSRTSLRQKRNFVNIEVGFPPPLSLLSFLFFLFFVLLYAFSTSFSFPFFFSSSSSVVFVWAC